MGVDVRPSVRPFTMKLKQEIWSLVILIEVDETHAHHTLAQALERMNWLTNCAVVGAAHMASRCL